MSTFYKPLSAKISEVPSIVYPMIGIETLLQRTSPGVIEEYIRKLLESHPNLYNCIYQIIILWRDQELMTDVWSFQKLESEAAGITIDCKTYQGLNEVHGNGLTASDGLIMLGRETELEETIRINSEPIIDKYVFGPRPTLPGNLNPIDSFYQPGEDIL